MEYEKYSEMAQRGGQEFERGDYAAAEATFRSLVESDISDIDKSLMYLNLILIAEKRSAPAEEIERLYDHALKLERAHRRYAATERKADWLARQSRNRESLRLYEEMLTYSELNDTDRARVRLNCDSLRSDFNRYSEAAQHAAGLMAEGKIDEAIAAFRELAAMDLSDIDRSMMCYNVAQAHEKKGDPRGALSWFERGVAYERPHRRFLVAEGMAFSLSQQGKTDEALRIYEDLLSRGELTEADKLRMRNNIEVLRAKK
jgi:tetratricopeptide (TPR) repeat protein